MSVNFLLGDTAEEEEQFEVGFKARIDGLDKPPDDLQKVLLDAWNAGYAFASRMLELDELDDI